MWGYCHKKILKCFIIHLFTGLDTSNISEPRIFPDEKIIEEGSDISLCCIGRKGQIIKEFFLNSPIPYFNRTNSQVGLLIAKNVKFKGVPHVLCRESCSEDNCFAHAVFFVGSKWRLCYNYVFLSLLSQEWLWGMWGEKKKNLAVIWHCSLRSNQIQVNLWLKVCMHAYRKHYWMESFVLNMFRFISLMI